MDPEDLAPRQPKAQLKNLEIMSIGELEHYVAELQAEIARTRAVIAAKIGHRSGADSLFKPRD